MGQKHTVILGMARSGVAAARLALQDGDRVTCLDLRPDAPVVVGTTACYGPHPEELFTDPERVSQIVVSPGVIARMPLLQRAIHAGIPVVGELGFAAAHLNIPLYAISGTNGKSTTTHLLGQILSQSGKKPFVGGNLGLPLSEAALASEGAYDCAAVEVSSYQMELPGSFHPAAAVILNLSPDHLERHGSMESYAAHKCRLFDRMTPEEGRALPADALLLAAAQGRGGRVLWLGALPGVEERGDSLIFEGVPDGGVVSLEGFPLIGPHNRQNLAAALLLANLAGVPRSAVRLDRLEGLPHRMAFAALHHVTSQPAGHSQQRQVTWINDSKATNVDSTLTCLRAILDLSRAVILLGGQGKSGAPYHELLPYLSKVPAILCFGGSGPEIAETLKLGGLAPECWPSLESAVVRARVLEQSLDVENVVLTPACASFDEFRNFEHRGEVFTALALDTDY